MAVHYSEKQTGTSRCLKH